MLTVLADLLAKEVSVDILAVDKMIVLLGNNAVAVCV
jgi:hypothetical protein